MRLQYAIFQEQQEDTHMPDANPKKRGFATPEYDPISGAIGYLSTEGKTPVELALLNDLQRFKASGETNVAAARSAIRNCALLIASGEGGDGIFLLII